MLNEFLISVQLSISYEFYSRHLDSVRKKTTEHLERVQKVGSVIIDLLFSFLLVL